MDKKQGLSQKDRKNQRNQNQTKNYKNKGRNKKKNIINFNWRTKLKQIKTLRPKKLKEFKTNKKSKE